MSQFPPQEPPAPPPPPPPGGGAPVSGGSQPAEPGAAFTYGWNKFKEHWQAVLVALIVGFVIIVVLGVIGYLIQSALTSTDSCTVRSTGNGLKFSGGCGDDGPGFFTYLFASALFQFLVFLGISVLQLFVIRATLMIMRGEPLEPSKVMSTDRLGNYMLGAIIVGILTFVGFVLCILPGIAVGIFVLFWGYFLVDKNMSPIEAITASFNLVKDNFGTVIVFWLLTIVITIAGAIVCGVGLIVAVPVVVIATGYMYKRLQGEPVAA
jgi:hypothetical protein